MEIYEGDIVQFKYYNAIKRWWKNTSEIPEIENQVQKQRENYLIFNDSIKFKNGGFQLTHHIRGEHIKDGKRFEKGTGTRHDYESKQWDYRKCIKVTYMMVKTMNKVSAFILSYLQQEGMTTHQIADKLREDTGFIPSSYIEFYIDQMREEHSICTENGVHYIYQDKPYTMPCLLLS